ncbi:MAG: hypothetical protein U5K76_08300 [Woeseiaceae bacterium]|nr:hypothetical protein [Woeseiaceae bacterium]
MRLLFVSVLLSAFCTPLAAQEEAGEAAADAEASRQVAEDAEREALEPGVPSAVLAEDVRRTLDDERVMDEMDLGRTEVTGNQELPKVLYIVPWQKSDPGDLMGRPVNAFAGRGSCAARQEAIPATGRVLHRSAGWQRVATV